MSTKPKRPEEVNGVRVRMPEDYDFNTWGISDYNCRQRLHWLQFRFQLKDRCSLVEAAIEGLVPSNKSGIFFVNFRFSISISLI